MFLILCFLPSFQTQWNYIWPVLMEVHGNVLTADTNPAKNSMSKFMWRPNMSLALATSVRAAQPSIKIGLL